MSRQSDHRVNLGTNNRYHLIWNEGNVRYSMTLDSRLVPDEHFYKMVPARTGQNAKSIKLSTSARVNAGRVANAISAAVEAKLFERAKEDYKKEYERRYWARVDAEARIAREIIELVDNFDRKNATSEELAGLYDQMASRIESV